MPPRTKGKKCTGDSILCIENRESKAASFKDVAPAKKDRWVRIGHGHGFEDVAGASGYGLRSFLTTNFAGAGKADYFLFVACDGYRCLYSGREIFETDDGNEMIIATTINGREPPRGYRLSSAADFFADRSMWGLSHVVRIPDVK